VIGAMVTQGVSIVSPAFLLTGLLLLLWFYTVWQSYVIERARAQLAGLQEIWRETLSSEAAWRHCPAGRIVQDVLDSNRLRLPRLSLFFLLLAAFVPSRKRDEARVRVYEGLSRLPSIRLQQEAVSVVETAARYVALAALKRSLVVWALAPLLFAVFIVWSVHWQLRIVLEGAPQASLQLARVRLWRRFLGPLVQIVTSAARS
jgi:hypothetical protein